MTEQERRAVLRQIEEMRRDISTWSASANARMDALDAALEARRQNARAA